jgi:hypothetical protein
MSFKGGVPWADIEAFYAQWLNARYAKFDVPSNEARQRIMQANRAVDAAKRYVATAEKVEFKDVDKAVRESAFGFGDSEHYQALSDAHDRLFQKAEELGERLGRKLGVKMADVTNFCDLDLVAAIKRPSTSSRPIRRSPRSVLPSTYGFAHWPMTCATNAVRSSRRTRVSTNPMWMLSTHHPTSRSR